MILRRSALLLALISTPLAARAAENAWTPLAAAELRDLPYEVVLSPDPAILYSSGGTTGPQRSDDGGLHWTALNVPFATGLPVVDPHDAAKVYLPAGSYLLRSADTGRSFTVAWHDAGAEIRALLVSRLSSSRAYFATGLELFESADGGVTFTSLGRLPGLAQSVDTLLVEAADGGLYLRRADPCGMHGCGPNWGLYRSPDGGRSWLQMRVGDASHPRIESLAAHPIRAEIVYFSEAGTPGRVLRSEDRGITAIDLGEQLGFQLVADASEPDALYQVGSRRLYKSDDRGGSFRPVALPIAASQLESVHFALASPGRIWLYRLRYSSAPPAAQAAVFKSDDGGASWTAIALDGRTVDHVDQLAIAGPAGVLYTKGYGPELRRSDDGGATWQSFLPDTSSFDDLAGDPFDAETLYAAGSIGNAGGLLRSRDGGRTFAVVAATDTYVLEILAFPRGNATTVVAVIGGSGEIARSADGGDTWVVENPPSVQGEPLEIDNVAWDGFNLFASSRGRLFGSTDGGVTFGLRDLGSSNVAAGGGLVARFDPFTSRIETSTSGGPPWQSRNLPFPIADLGLRLEVDPRGTCYLVGAGLLLRSHDRGRTWQTLSQDLPWSTFSPRLAFDPQDAERLYLGTTSGLFAGRFADQPLALLRGRFEARLRWRTGPSMPWASATGSALADQSGVFRPFTEDRVEVAVQILDGRPLNGRFWVYVASMTDVELELELTDRLEGEIWQHHQDAGHPHSTSNLEAFPHLPQRTGGGLPQPFGGPVSPQEEVLVMSRFAVSVSLPATGGPPRQAVGIPLFRDTAGFSFDVPGATDLLVNVIDARGVNGKVWVFGGSLTDQEFDLRIEDTLTDTVYTYHNPAGAFAGFGDVGAF